MGVKKKYVYFFGDGKAEGKGDMKNLLGGKGAGLAEMTNLNISVPAGFTITTEACVEYYKRGKTYPPGMWEEALQALKRVERSMGAKFGDPANPLLVSVRSGARASIRCAFFIRWSDSRARSGAAGSLEDAMARAVAAFVPGRPSAGANRV